jgi:hypothetical protein
VSELRVGLSDVDLEWLEAKVCVPLHHRPTGEIVFEAATFSLEMLQTDDSPIVKEAATHLLYQGTPVKELVVRMYQLRIRHAVGCAAEVLEFIKQKLCEAFASSGFNIVFIEG